jgi:hypothetical protein
MMAPHERTDQLVPGSGPGQAIPAKAGIQWAAILDTGFRRYDEFHHQEEET